MNGFRNVIFDSPDCTHNQLLTVFLLQPDSQFPPPSCSHKGRENSRVEPGQRERFQRGGEMSDSLPSRYTNQRATKNKENR